MIGHRHLADKFLATNDFLAGDHRLDLRSKGAGCARDNLALLTLARVIHQHLEHEPVALRLRQRIGAFLFHRVLRSQHKERLIQRVRLAADCHRVFLHGLQQGRLRLGRAAVNLIGQDHLGENRAAREHQAATAFRIILNNLRAGDVRGHQVGGKLHALKR